MSLTQPASAGQLLSLTCAAFRLLSHRERRQAILLVSALVSTGLVDMVALAAVMPVIAIIVEPDLVTRYEILTLVRSYLPGLTTDQFVIAAALAAAFFLILSTGLGLVMLWVNNRFGAAIQTRFGYDIMLAAMRAPYIWHLSQNSATLVRFLHSDIIRWGRDFIQRLITMTQHLVSMVVPLVLLLFIAPVSGLLGLLMVGLIGFFLARLVQPRLKRAASASKLSTDRLVVLANNAMSGVKDIKLACKEDHFAHDFANIFGYASRASSSLSTWQALPSSMLLLLGQLALLALAVILWARGLSQGAIAGQMALIALVTSRVVPAANRFLGLSTSIWNVLPWVEEVIRVERELAKLNVESQQLGAPAAPETWQILTLDNVSFTYPGKHHPAVCGISVKITRGRSYGFVGMSGAGKSTLVDLIVGLYRPDGRGVLLDDASLYDFGMKTWQRQIGYVPQSPYIADDTLKANVALGTSRREVDEARVRQCLDLANLTEFVGTLPLGINTPVGDRGVRMSGGQRQRLSIARAFYQSPQLLVLDEATSSLDLVSEKEIQQAITRLRGKVTMLIIAHRLATVRECDEIIYIDEGCLVAHGTFEELLSKVPGFRALATQLEPTGH